MGAEALMGGVLGLFGGPWHVWRFFFFLGKGGWANTDGTIASSMATALHQTGLLDGARRIHMRVGFRVEYQHFNHVYIYSCLGK
jgi:hypothetical protein